MKKSAWTQEQILEKAQALVRDRGFRTRAELKASPEGQEIYKALSNRGLICLLDDFLPKAGYGIAGITDSKKSVEAYVRDKKYRTRKQMKHDWGEGSLVYSALNRLGKIHWLDDILPYRKQKSFSFQNFEEFEAHINEKGYTSRTALALDRQEGAKLYAWIYREGKDEWLERALPKRKLESKQTLTQEAVENFVKERGYRSRSEMKHDFANGGSAMMSWLWKYSKVDWLDQVLPPHGHSRKEFTRTDIEGLVKKYGISSISDFRKFREAKVAYHWMRREGRLSLLDGLIYHQPKLSQSRIEYTREDIEKLIKAHGIKTRIEFSKNPETRSAYAWLSYWRKLDYLDPFLPRYGAVTKKAG